MVSVVKVEAVDGQITYLENRFLGMHSPLRVFLKGVDFYERPGTKLCHSLIQLRMEYVHKEIVKE